MLLESPKNRFFGSKKLQTKKKADDGSEFERAFGGAVQFGLDSGFPIFLSWNLSRKKPCSTSSSEKMCLRCFQLDAGILWSFKSFQGYVHICTIESSTILKRPSGRLDWCTHKRAQRSCKTCKHKNYCRSIRRKENLKVINSRNLVGLFKATSIFLTSMEEVILLGLSGSTKSSLTWSSGGNTFSFCLNKDFGGTFGWKLNVDFFLAGLLEVGELCGTFTHCPREFPVLSFLSAPWASDQPSL